MTVQKFLDENHDIKHLLLAENERVMETLCTALSGEKITEITLIAKGSTNRSYLVCTTQNSYVLRIPGIGSGEMVDRYREKEIYDLAVKDKMEHLFAKTTLIKINSRVVSIMPKINHIRNYDRWWEDYCTDAERAWLWSHVADLHRGNVGYKRNKICIVDYAYVA